MHISMDVNTSQEQDSLLNDFHTLIEQMVVFMPINYILFHSGKYGASIVIHQELSNCLHSHQSTHVQ